MSEHLPADSSAHVELTEVPFHPQSAYQCGPAALATVLEWSGYRVSAEELVPRVYLPARRGSLQPEMTATARHFERLAYPLEPSLAALLAEVAAGHPVLVLQNLGTGFLPVWHYAVVIGFDADRQQVLLRSGTTRREVLSAARFMATWERAERWALVVLPAGRMPASADFGRYLEAAADLEATSTPQAAEAAWRTAAVQWPGSAMGSFGLGNALYAQDDLAGAVAAFGRALEIDTGHLGAHHNLAQVFLSAGCPQRARDQLALARRHLHRLPAMAAMLDALEAQLDAPNAAGGPCALP